MKGISFTQFNLLAAIAGTSLIATSGCTPKVDPTIPPTVEQIFVGASTPGANLGPEPGLVTLDPILVDAPYIEMDLTGETPLVCYTTNGTMPIIKDSPIGSYCFGGTLPYHDYALIYCDGATETVEKTLTITYRWKVEGVVSEETVQAPYALDCVAPPAGSVRFKVGGSGAISGGSEGTVKILGGNALFTPRDPDDVESLDVLAYSAVVETEAGKFSKVAASSEATIYGTFIPDTDGEGNVIDENVGTFAGYSEVLDRGTVTKCTNLGGLLDGCGQIEVGVETPITVINTPADPTNPVDLTKLPFALNLNAGEKSTFALFLSVDAPVVGAVNTVTAFELEALP